MNAPTPPSATPGSSNENAGTNDARRVLSRRLGLSVAISVVVGNVIGSGIFLKPGTIAAEAGRFDLIIAIWIFGGLFCLLGGLCFAELGTMFPEAGGLYAYLRESFGRPVAFLFGWSEFLFNRPAGTAALSVAFVGSLLNVLQWKLGTWEQVALVSFVIASLATINILGVHWGGGLQLGITILKAGNLAVVAALPFVMTLLGYSGAHAANYGTTVTPLQPTLLAQGSVALLAVMWAYHGWHGLAPLAEEIREPQRNIPRAFLIGIGILTVLYVSANIAYHGVLSMGEMAAARKGASELMLRTLLGPWGSAAMSAVIMASTFGAINANLLESPRVSFAMGRDGVFFQSLGLVHARYRTPAVAISVMAAMAVITVTSAAAAKEWVQDWSLTSIHGELARRIVKSLQDNSVFDLLTNFVVFGSSVFFVLGVLAVFLLRFTRPNHPRPYKTWGYPWTPLAFLLFNLFFLWQVYLSQPLESRLGLLLIALGLPVYGLFVWKNRQKAGAQ